MPTFIYLLNLEIFSPNTFMWCSLYFSDEKKIDKKEKATF